MKKTERLRHAKLGLSKPVSEGRGPLRIPAPISQAGGRRFDPGTLHSKNRCYSAGSFGDFDEADALFADLERFWSGTAPARP
jgi:hypothetical protein